MPDASPTSWLDDLRRLGLLDASRLAELSRSAVTPEMLTQLGWLTPYQARRLKEGEGDTLLLGRYELQEPVGEGGMGQVFKARDRRTGARVALKVIRKERLDSPEVARRFRREIQFAAKLDHPNIVRVLDADEVNGTFFFAMELVEGVDLGRLVQRAGPLSVPQACAFIREAALGLQHAHEKGLVHRDIKPQNMLLLGATRSIKLMDLGLALGPTEQDDGSGTLTKTGIVMGTLDYLAPEQAMDAHHVDIRADIYSLGCTFYYLLVGRAPFAAANSLNKLYAHRHSAPVPLERSRPEVPLGICRVVRKLMAKQPIHRFQTPAEVARVLATWNGTDVDVTGVAEPPEGPAVLVAAPVLSTAAQDATDTAPSAKASTGDLAFDLSITTIRPAPPKASRRELGWLLFAVLVVAIVVGVAGVLLPVLHKVVAPRPTPSSKPETEVVVEKPPIPESPFDLWLKRTTALAGEAQLDPVLSKLRELNAGLPSKPTYIITGGVVTELTFSSDGITDLRPLQALKGLRRLRMTGKSRKGSVTDLSPLAGLRLELLYLNHNGSLRDLAPLQDMPLYDLNLDATAVDDLGPLKNITRLKLLTIANTAVRDVEPLRGLPLEKLSAEKTRIDNIDALRGMPLKTLYLNATNVTSLAPVEGAAVTDLWFDALPDRDADVLRSLKSLKTLNGKPVALALKDLGIEPK